MPPSRPAALSADLELLKRAVSRAPTAALTSQRWFRAKGRSVAGLSLADAACLAPDPAGLGLDAALLIVSATYADTQSEDRYFIPVVIDRQPVARPPGAGAEASDVARLAVSDAETGTVVREPADGDHVWSRMLAAMRSGLHLPGLRGGFAFEAVGDGPPSGGAERRLTAEQTNSSIVVGDAILKLYRLVEPGENLDLQVSAFLAEVGFLRTPPLLGAARYRPTVGERSTLAMLQSRVPNDGDGWSWLLDRLRAAAGGPLEEALAGVADIGALTAELHAALGSRSADPAFPHRPAHAADLASWRASALSQLSGALGALRGEQAARLRAIEPALRRRLDTGFGATSDKMRAPAAAVVSRVHGDYHLGQLLHGGDGFTVIDFEGEPARPARDRRLPTSPLKDVAGMLRSFDYAARTVAADAPVSIDADAFLSRSRSRFLEAYAAAGGALNQDLLDAFELEKACYEVRYEAANRPEWTWLPLEALERLAAWPAHRPAWRSVSSGREPPGRARP
ncbi:MAG: hypothetical protein M3Y88_01690 [Chloroflexota bacterium]|nr:hypothetical protein [Chloroflexota bacterium]